MLSRYFSLFLFSLLSFTWAHGHTDFDVRDFGAVGDGKTKNTEAFAKAIAACAAGGGGTLHIPSGRYLTGSIELVSNLTLDLDAGAVLLYSPDPADSPLVRSRWECTTAWTHAPLLHADGKENIAIVGRGTINGQGENWWWRSGKDKDSVLTGDRKAIHDRALAAWKSLMDRYEQGDQPKATEFTLAAEYLRPALIETYHCHHILVDGVTITDSPFWLLHPLYSEDIVVHGVSFVSWGRNGDGIDVDSCRNVRISDCFFRTGDDCIVIKSGRDADGRRVASPTEHVVVDNCVMYEGHGAIVIGSETSGDIRNITASNIVAKGTDCGIRIKTDRGRGGCVENMRFDNFVIEDAAKQAIEITMLYSKTRPEPVSVRTPSFKNLSLSNISIINAKQVASIHGLPERAITQLRFSDITASGLIGFVCDNTNQIELHNVRVDTPSGQAFDFRAMQEVDLDNVTSFSVQKGTPVIRLKNSEGIWLHNSQAKQGTDMFLQVEGESPQRLVISNNEFSAARSPVVYLK
jgi:polygalacturonase